MSWDEGPERPVPRLGAGDWLRVARRGAPLALTVFGGLALHLLLRVIEWPVCGAARPVTSRLTQVVCRVALRTLGITVIRHGTPMQTGGAMVANHASWLDVFVLNAQARVHFIAKAEVAGWPGIGWLARATGTLFVQRDPRQARAQTAQLSQRLTLGQRLMFFPEGTSTDGRRVLAFKTSLFASFLADPHPLWIQPVCLHYTDPPGGQQAFYGWWGEMAFGAHLLEVLAQKRQGSVSVRFLPPRPVAAFTDRKALARALETDVRAGLDLPQG